MYRIIYKQNFIKLILLKRLQTFFKLACVLCIFLHIDDFKSIR
jgi:hypothetical protein